MHQKVPEFQIGKESRSVSSDSNPSLPLPFSTSLQIQNQLNRQKDTTLNSNQSQSQIHLTIQIPPIPSRQLHPPNPPPRTQQNNFHHEPISNSPSASHTPLSTPHKRPIMTQSSSTLSNSPTLSSLRHNQQQNQLAESSSPSFSCCTSFTTPFVSNSFTPNFLRHLRCARLLRLHFRFLIALSLPSFYFFIPNPGRSFLIDFLSVIAFSAALLFSLNLALPRLPSIRLFLARSFPIKLCSSFCATKPHQPILWSIGSKPKPEKRATSGSWVQVYSNGDAYEGEFHKGKCSGSGVYYYHMSGRYEGAWVDGKYDGYGVETWARGSRYRGQYRQGLRHGIGIYRFYTGDVYAGEWSNGQCHGCGVHSCEDGSRYVGEFKWGVKHGLGNYHFRNGDIYAGEYFADKMHGFGVYQFGNGHRYEGAWHEGIRQGFGMYTFRNGEAQSGHWQNGVLDNLSMQNIHPGSLCVVNHTRVLNAIQEARRASEKAYDVVKVDERVSKSIADANKAANAARVAAVKAVQNRMHHNNNDQ
ncbi:putative 1-phosphatidylinositol-4-phosphate 5-kinase [Quillaja saponaria]|uniref:1-phosphatidylinositol-4-phosphate 5-kinase n=1 Tax=Quillaja saponaria TaxID=32244 RepID=A0AAD7L876_QUISA|nr:putative 1-phosphatidylinositol-4-phosphate 5-kinase [Quillaja saponaria]